jgi:hypothetical protein
VTSARSEGPSDTAVTIGAQAVAAFADEYKVQLPPQLTSAMRDTSPNGA